ncbi:hypothetical protein HJA60_004180 [Vibrio vulnificus]|nr:hypothetical protein [Vibrio vulnificus]MCU8278077.1 hypothetical protein [Vibrio vulnificus]
MSNVIYAEFTTDIDVGNIPSALTLGPNNVGFIHEKLFDNSLTSIPYSPLQSINGISNTSMGLSENALIDFEGQAHMELTTEWNLELNNDTTTYPLRFLFKMHVPLQHMYIGKRPRYYATYDLRQPGDEVDDWGSEYTKEDHLVNVTIETPVGKTTFQMSCIPTSHHTKLSVDVQFSIIN